MWKVNSHGHDLFFPDSKDDKSPNEVAEFYAESTCLGAIGAGTAGNP